MPSVKAAATKCVAALFTCPSAEIAAQLAQKLVEQRLAACVNIIDGVRSIYRWQGKVCDDAEVLCVAKTRETAISELELFLNDHHPYDVPELITLDITSGSADYLDWLLQQVTSS